LALPAPEYLALAYRLSAYPGVLAARMEQERKRAEDLGEDVTVASVASAAQLDDMIK
jgi:hypothetical protein